MGEFHLMEITDYEHSSSSVATQQCQRRLMDLPLNWLLHGNKDGKVLVQCIVCWITVQHVQLDHCET